MQWRATRFCELDHCRAIKGHGAGTNRGAAGHCGKRRGHLESRAQLLLQATRAATTKGRWQRRNQDQRTKTHRR